MTCGKNEFLKYFILQGNTLKVLGCLWEFLICGLSYEYFMVAQLTKIYGAKRSASSIFFVGGAQAPILHTTYFERSP